MMVHSNTALFVLCTATIVAKPATAFVPAFTPAATTRSCTSLRAESESFHRSLLEARIENERKADEAAIAAAEYLLEESEAADDAAILAAAEALTAVVELGETVELTPVEEVEEEVVMEEAAPVIAEEEIETVEATVTIPEEEEVPIIPPVAAATATIPPEETKEVKPVELKGVPRELAIVPINEDSVQFTAGLLGAGLCLALGGGPILAAVGAAAFNYVARKDDADIEQGTTASGKKVVDAASQTALLAYNFVANVERENAVLDSVVRSLESAASSAKKNSEAAAPVVEAVESTLKTAASVAQNLDDDYDIVDGAGTILNSVGDLIEVGGDKVGKLNEEYGFAERLVDAAKGFMAKLGDLGGVVDKMANDGQKK